jgi:hypothetical protein
MRDQRFAARSVIVCAVFMVLAVEGRGQTTLAVTFGEQSITFSGVTPGGKLAVFGVARELLNTSPAIPAIVVRAEILADADRDGVVRFDLPIRVPRLGMWAATDLENGAHMAFPTPGYSPRLITVGSELLRNDNGGQLRKLEWPFSEIDVVVMRPREGAWRFYASKASGADENRDNGNRLLRVDLRSMTAIGQSPEGPHNFRNGDIVAIFDRSEMQYGIIEVGR